MTPNELIVAYNEAYQKANKRPWNGLFIYQKGWFTMYGEKIWNYAGGRHIVGKYRRKDILEMIKTLVERSPYWKPLPDYGDLMTVADFIEACEDGCLIDYDGHGYPVKDGLMDDKLSIDPSDRDQIPADATHILWFNR